MNDGQLIGRASAPGKVILFGEHAINRGQPAIAASVGLYARCCIQRIPGELIEFQSAAGSDAATPEAIVRFGARVRGASCDEIRALARADYFAPQKFILSQMFGEKLGGGLRFSWESEVPPSSGLGSGGSAFTAMVTAALPLLDHTPTLEQRADWARLGDLVAHGGVASGLDTQTSLLGGVIWFTGESLAEPVPCADGMRLVIGNTGVAAPTSEVNTRVRLWLEGSPGSRVKYFQTVGALSRAARPLFAQGNWDEIGRLMNLNQLVLEKIGVSTPRIERMCEAALRAGAFGCKISGSGGGGIVVALSSAQRQQAIAEAFVQAGGSALCPDIAVAGASASN